MKLAREFSRPDWRAMLSQMSSTELREWELFYKDEFFSPDLIDAHFSNLSYHITGLACNDHEQTPADYSLLVPRNIPAKNIETSDETMMDVAESIPGGTRYGPVAGGG